VLPHRNPIATAERLSRRQRRRSGVRRSTARCVRYYDDVREIAFEVFGEFLRIPAPT
jgi:hypothetical protein